VSDEGFYDIHDRINGLLATIAEMIAVTAMGSQFSLLRLTLTVAPSTAAMTGNVLVRFGLVVAFSARFGFVSVCLLDGTREPYACLGRRKGCSNVDGGEASEVHARWARHETAW
jgi:hypothetical protein